MRQIIQATSVFSSIALGVSELLALLDWLNHSYPSLPHLLALGLSLTACGVGGFLDRARTAWFGWLAYGTMMASVGLGMPLAMAVIEARAWPPDPNFREVIIMSLLLFSLSLPAVLLARRRIRSASPVTQR